MPGKLIFANRYFYPDLSATSQILSDLTRRLAQSGIEVHVVTSRQLYEKPAAGLGARDTVAGVCVHRVRTATFGRRHLLGRTLDYLSFYLSAGIRLLRMTRRGDVLVAKTDPPLLSIVGAVVAAMRGAILVNWLQDVFPEVATRLRVTSVPRRAERWLQAVRDMSLIAARVNVVLGVRMRDYLLSRGVPVTHVRVIENWADGVLVQPKPLFASELRGRLGLQGKFVVGYSGNLGRAHEFDTLLQAAEQLHGDPDYAFLMTGGGVGMSALRTMVEKRGLRNFCFMPYAPRPALSDSLAAADVHLVCLLPTLEGLIVPSKIYGILAAGRPTIFIGEPDGEIGRILGEGGCGRSVRCGDGAALARELRELHANAHLAEVMGRRARVLFDRHYTLEGAVEKWLDMATEFGLRAPDVTRPSSASHNSAEQCTPTL